MQLKSSAPKVSVIIATHSRPELLPRAIESARAAGRDVEVVVVDDASTDATARVCQDMSAINYVRVEHNQQVAGGRNIGILRSQGEYLSFLDDDDDMRLAGSLDMQVRALESAPAAGLIYAPALIADQAGIVGQNYYPRRCPQGDIFWELMGRNFIPCGTVAFRRSCLSCVGLLDQSVPGIDDWDLWLRIASLYPVMALAQPVLIWRKSTPASGQGTSRAAGLITLSTRQPPLRRLLDEKPGGASRSTRRASWFLKRGARSAVINFCRRSGTCAPRSGFIRAASSGGRPIPSCGWGAGAAREPRRRVNQAGP